MSVRIVVLHTQLLLKAVAPSLMVGRRTSGGGNQERKREPLKNKGETGRVGAARNNER